MAEIGLDADVASGIIIKGSSPGNKPLGVPCEAS